uniref:O-methyltransferase C-terminal domain-containing protein n=1 Tax=Amphimedon queenslandica TaxID=400682 RepID=A0A1X7TE69_AMPQE
MLRNTFHLCLHGNFTDKLPQFDCDCYILKDILQNWSDEDALLILCKVESVAKRNKSRLVIIEKMIHTDHHAEEKLRERDRLKPKTLYVVQGL